jgi:hypothetical protein
MKGEIKKKISYLFYSNLPDLLVKMTIRLQSGMQIIKCHYFYPSRPIKYTLVNIFILTYSCKIEAINCIF